MTPILAIDPGTTKSAWLIYDGEGVVTCGIDANEFVKDKFAACYRRLCEGYVNPLQPAIEMIASYGMPVGKETFETCLWIGRFLEAFGGGELVYRKDVKLHLCHSVRAKDANVRQSLIDLFPATGGGKVKQIGTKKEPGPLYGVSSHCWSALAVAITYANTRFLKPANP